MTKTQLAALIAHVTDHDDLKILRAIINGKLGRRTITQEQQDRMQAARKKKADDKEPAKDES